MSKRYKAGYLGKDEPTFLKRWMIQRTLSVAQVAIFLQVTERSVRRYLVSSEDNLPLKTRAKLSDFP